jgi:hypothetical protein
MKFDVFTMLIKVGVAADDNKDRRSFVAWRFSSD